MTIREPLERGGGGDGCGAGIASLAGMTREPGYMWSGGGLMVRLVRELRGIEGVNFVNGVTVECADGRGVCVTDARTGFSFDDTDGVADRVSAR